MRISQLRRQTVVPSFFASSKCKVAIPLRNVLLRDALQQASLELRFGRSAIGGLRTYKARRSRL